MLWSMVDIASNTLWERIDFLSLDKPCPDRQKYMGTEQQDNHPPVPHKLINIIDDCTNCFHLFLHLLSRSF